MCRGEITDRRCPPRLCTTQAADAPWRPVLGLYDSSRHSFNDTHESIGSTMSAELLPETLLDSKQVVGHLSGQLAKVLKQWHDAVSGEQP